MSALHFNADKLVRWQYYLGDGLKAGFALREWAGRMNALDREKKDYLRKLGADSYGDVSDELGVPHYALLVWRKKPDALPGGVAEPVWMEEEKCWAAFPTHDDQGKDIVAHFDRFDPLMSASRAMLGILHVEGEVRLPDGQRCRPTAMPLSSSGKVALLVPDDGRGETIQAPDWMREVGREKFQKAQQDNEAAVRKAMEGEAYSQGAVSPN